MQSHTYLATKETRFQVASSHGHRGKTIKLAKETAAPLSSNPNSLEQLRNGAIGVSASPSLLTPEVINVHTWSESKVRSHATCKVEALAKAFEDLAAAARREIKQLKLFSLAWTLTLTHVPCDACGGQGRDRLYGCFCMEK